MALGRQTLSLFSWNNRESLVPPVWTNAVTDMFSRDKHGHVESCGHCPHIVWVMENRQVYGISGRSLVELGTDCSRESHLAFQ